MLLSAEACLVGSLALTFLACCFLRAWAYVLLLLLTELSWVFICALYAQLAVGTSELSLLFAALALLLFSAVELICMALAFCAWAQLTGQAALRVLGAKSLCLMYRGLVGLISGLRLRTAAVCGYWL
jgi:hypothetical protein